MDDRYLEEASIEKMDNNQINYYFDVNLHV